MLTCVCLLSPNIPGLRKPQSHQSWQDLLKMLSSFSSEKGLGGGQGHWETLPWCLRELPAKISYPFGGRFAVGTTSPSAWSLQIENTQDMWASLPQACTSCNLHPCCLLLGNRKSEGELVVPLGISAAPGQNCLTVKCSSQVQSTVAISNSGLWEPFCR